MDFTVEQFLFYILAALVVGSALIVVAMKNVIRSVFLFFVSLFSLAGVYVFTLADFVAVAQVVVYVGGVLVLMIFAFLLSDRQLLNLPSIGKNNSIGIHHIPGLIIALGFFGILMATLQQLNGQFGILRQGQALGVQDNTLHLLGMNLMTRYLIPFELLSVLLMVALIGAAHLARRERRD